MNFKMVFILFVVSLSFFSQKVCLAIEPPLIGKTNDTTYFLMEFSVRAYAGEARSSDSNYIVFGGLSHFNGTKISNSTGESIQYFRMLDIHDSIPVITRRNNETLKIPKQNTIFSYPILVDLDSARWYSTKDYANSAYPGRTRYIQDSLGLGRLLMDTVLTRYFSLVNAGGAKMNLQKGSYYDTTNNARIFKSDAIIGDLKIMRKGWKDKLNWRLSDNVKRTELVDDWEQGSFPECRNYPNKDIDTADHFIQGINPGANSPFIIEVQPREVGLMNDTISLCYNTGLDTMAFKIPLGILSRWPIKYIIPDTIHRNGRLLNADERLNDYFKQFDGWVEIPILITNNRDNRTRITSLDFTFLYNPSILSIQFVRFNDTAFAGGRAKWKFDSLAYDHDVYKYSAPNSEVKHGTFRIRAVAQNQDFVRSMQSKLDDINEGLYTVSNSEDISTYLISGSQSKAGSDTMRIATIEALVCLSDTTSFNFKLLQDTMDTVVVFPSQHNMADSVTLYKNLALQNIRQPELILEKGKFDAAIPYHDARKIKKIKDNPYYAWKKLYPNPLGLQKKMKIDFTAIQEFELTIYVVDVTGSVRAFTVPSKVNTGDNGWEINLNELTTGRYLLVVKANDQYESFNFTKE